MPAPNGNGASADHHHPDVSTENATNRHAVLTGLAQLTIEERPLPTPGAGDILVKMMSTGICGTDVSYYKRGAIGASIVSCPHVLGHEGAGIVAALGPGVRSDRVRVGDKVAIEPALPCWDCNVCRTGETNYCKEGGYLAAPGADGTLCQWASVPARNAVHVPEDITWAEAGCIQPLAIAIQVARRVKLKAHDNVVVLGSGPLGLLCMAVAKAYGARIVVAVDLSAARVDFAKTYAATHGFVNGEIKGEVGMETINGFAQGMLAGIGLPRGVDVVIETTGAESCIQLGIALLKHGGNFLQAGLGPALVQMPIVDLTMKQINLHGAFHYTHGCFEDGIDLLERGLVDVKPLITKTVPLSRATDAFEAAASGEEVKVVIMNQE